MMSKISRNGLLTWIPELLFGAFFLLVPALYNSFPLVTSDSGAYFANAYLRTVPMDRPISYSIFALLSSMGISVWGIVIAQALIVSGLLLVITKRYLGQHYRRNVFIAIMLLTGIATSAGWFTGQLMPDIFTAVLLLAVCILTTGNSGSGMLDYCLYALIFFCVIAHNSNLLVSLMLGTLLLYKGLRRKDALLWKPGRMLVAVAIAGWLTLSLCNVKAHHGFRPSAASHVFIFSRMIENGIAESFLQDRCAVEGNSAYKMCAYRNQLPNRQWDFMWNEASPLYTTGGWVANEKEYNRIIRKTLTTPKYLAMHIVQNTQATLRQLPLIYVGDGLQQFGAGSSPYSSISNYSNHELREFNSALQQTGGLKLDFWNGLITIFSLLSMAVALLARPRNAVTAAIRDSMRRMIRLTLVFLGMNAAVTATFSTILGRYESRVFWVLPFLCMLYLTQYLLPKGATTKQL